MNRVGQTRATLHRPGSGRTRPSHWATALVGTGTGAASGAAAGDADVAATFAGTPLALALVALALVIGALLALRAMRSQQRLTDELRAARSEVQTIEQLLDVWIWRSDREHRLVSIRPPLAAPTGDWSATTESGFVWERFISTDEAALKARLLGAAPLDDVPVVLASAAGAAVRPGVLRGRSHTDAAGRFAGYHGIVRELNAPPIAASAAAIPPLATASDTPAATDSVPGADHETFSFTVSHDLRAPIRVVEGFTKIIKEDYGRLLDRVGNDHLDRVLGAAARMNNMIDALLALSKLSSQPLARQPVDLSQLAGFVADDLRRQAPERDVRLEIEPGMQAQGDPTLLRVVIENLLGNAWKYTGKSAQARITFGRHAQQADTFTVADTGAGFDMRFADRLFGVFQRLHSANDFPGTGVGLASVRRIVRRHGGEIWGEGEVNRGAQFHFSLPQAPAPSRR
jgi:signal transduction histidine kinase